MNKVYLNQPYSLHVSQSKYYLYLFILWPFLALLLAIKNYSQKEARKVVYIFLIYYGLTFVVGNNGVDAEGYLLHLKEVAKLPFSDFFKIFGGLYSSNTTVDIVEPLISFIVSRFTSYHGIIFGVWAALFGFFYLKSINLLHNLYQERPSKNSIIFLTFFVLVIPITTINGVRMYTAAWIFFYGAYHVILYRDPRFLLLAISSSLVHFSFFAANVILIIYYFAGNRNIIYLPFALLSFVLPKLIAPIFYSISIRLGGAFQSRYETYTGESYLNARQNLIEKASWFMQIGNDLVFYYLLIAIVVIQLKFGNLMKDKAEKNLFSFLLLFMAFTNFANAIPTFGGRFQTLFFLFATFYVFLYSLKCTENKINLLTWLGIFPMALYVAVVFRMGSESISPWILAPGLGLPWIDPALSIADLLFR
jgi:hypothetical protein